MKRWKANFSFPPERTSESARSLCLLCDERLKECCGRLTCAYTVYAEGHKDSPRLLNNVDHSQVHSVKTSHPILAFQVSEYQSTPYSLHSEKKTTLQ